MIYLDHAATTRPEPEVIEAVKKVMEEDYANPSSSHSFGVKARAVCNRARKEIAVTLGESAKDSEIFFTSGGTEGNNWCVKMAAGMIPLGKKAHIVSTAMEHPSVLESLKQLEREGRAEVTLVNPGKDGRVRAEDVLEAIRPDTVLVSVMYANNETGVIQPVPEIGSRIRRMPFNCFGHKILFHTDAVQAYGHIPLDVGQMNVDFLVTSAHKFYGPKGVGFLYKKESVNIAPWVTGGGQESGLRSGTENVPGIAGMAVAATFAFHEMEESGQRERMLRRRLMNGLLEAVPGLIVNGDQREDNHVPGTLNVSVPGIGGEAIMVWLDMRGICISTGSACAAGKQEPSHVLLSMGAGNEVAENSLRFSLGRENTEEEIDRTVETVKETVGKIRGILG